MEAGFRYDSSSFPIATTGTASRTPHASPTGSRSSSTGSHRRNGCVMPELPLSRASIPAATAGGGRRLLPVFSPTGHASRHPLPHRVGAHRRRRLPPPVELDRHQPRLPAGTANPAPHSINIDETEDKLCRLSPTPFRPRRAKSSPRPASSLAPIVVKLAAVVGRARTSSRLPNPAALRQHSVSTRWSTRPALRRGDVGGFFADLALPEPDVNLGSTAPGAVAQIAEIMARLEPVLVADGPTR